VPPYNDIRVRTALQKAIDLPKIARTYYGGAVKRTDIADLQVHEKGGFPYSEWPEDLKDEYAYNPAGAKGCWQSRVS